MPNGVVKHLETRLLKEIVNRAIHPIRCAESCKRKYQKGLRIGDLCAETGHFWWALKVWRMTAKLIENKDWDDWIDVPFHTEWVSLSDVISETEYELLLKRCGDMLQALGYPEEYWWSKKEEHYAERYFGLRAYRWLFVEKHCGYYFFDMETEDSEDWEDDMRRLSQWCQTQEFFRQAQGDSASGDEPSHTLIDDLACYDYRQ